MLSKKQPMGQGPKLLPDKGIFTCNHAHTTTGLYTKKPYTYAHRNIHMQPCTHNHMNIPKKYPYTYFEFTHATLHTQPQDYTQKNI